jgi:hypothetical protein
LLSTSISSSTTSSSSCSVVGANIPLVGQARL